MTGGPGADTPPRVDAPYTSAHVAAAGLAGIIVGYAIGTLVAPPGASAPASPVPMTASAPASSSASAGPTDDEFAAVQRVAARFRCGCGACEGEPLDRCDCGHPGGAVEVKGFILTHLRRGLSEDAAAQAVAARYPAAVVPGG